MTARRALAFVVAVALVGCSASSAAPDKTYNGCAADAFVDASPTITFGGQSGSPLFGYSPACLRVSAGATVTFAGDFSVHPMSPGTSPTSTTDGSGNNPIPRTAVGDSLTVTFANAGTYPYFCEAHYAAGMAGVVFVQ